MNSWAAAAEIAAAFIMAQKKNLANMAVAFDDLRWRQFRRRNTSAVADDDDDDCAVVGISTQFAIFDLRLFFPVDLIPINQS